jgi:hypothetical protein
MAQAHSESVEKHKPLPTSKPVEQPADRAVAPGGDANMIGSPDVFLTERHRELPRGSVRIHQVRSDGGDRAYVITQGSQIGYFELSEGMSRADAEAALAHAFDGAAVVL